MSNFKIVKEDIGKKISLDIKRFYIPGTKIIGNCPECGEYLEKDFDEQYLSYPSISKNNKEYMYCDECDNEAEIELRLNISLDLIEGEENA